MAKQQTKNLGSSLIQSAKYMYSTKNKAVNADSFMQGLQNYTSDYRQKKEAELEKQETKASNYLGQMEVMDMGIVPEQYSEKVENSLKYLRDEYFKTTMMLKDLKPTDRQYLEHSNRLNQLNTSIKKISSVFSDLNTNKEEDLKTIRNKNYSKGNDLGKVSFINNVLTGDAELEITENGEVYFKNDKNQWVTYDKIPDLTPFASKEFKAIQQQAAALASSKRKITTAEKDLLRASLKGLILDGGKDIAISLASDDFIVPGGMGIIDAETAYNENPDAFVNQVINSYMSFYEKTADEGYQAHIKQLYTDQAIKNSGKSTGGKLTEKEKMAQYINSEAGWENLKETGHKSGNLFYEWDEEQGAFVEYQMQMVPLDNQGKITFRSQDKRDQALRPYPTGRIASNPKQLVTITGLVQPQGFNDQEGLPRSN